MARIVCVAVVLAAVVLGSCGGTDKAALTGAAGDSGAPALHGGLSSLPTDGVQPWESLDSRGYVIPQSAGSGGAGIPVRDTDRQEWPSHRSTSAFPVSSEFALGVERFSEGGNATDNGAATKLIADMGAIPLSYALYRFTMAGSQPGAVAVDANLNIGLHGKLSQYWVGVSDYGENTWQWHGPFTDAQVAFTLDAGDYTSALGNTFIAVAVHGGSDLDVVGVTVSADDTADTTAPPAPGAAPLLTPVASGIEAEWLPVIAGDLAGYRVYWSYSPFTSASDNGVQSVEWLENTTRIMLPSTTGRMTWVGISAVDVNGNESALSPVASAQRLSNETAPLLSISVSPVSVLRGEHVTLVAIPDPATPVDSYDFDLDGDGVFELTGTATAGQIIPTDATGIIRPRVRASNAAGTAVALGSVSLIVSGNQRPVANAQCTPQTGVAPLTVTMNGTGEDFDGAISEYAWDFDGDGIYDHNSGADGITAETYTQPGLYNAKLRVTDDQGAWDVDTVAVQVLEAEVAMTVSPASVNAGESATLSLDLPGPASNVEWDLDGNGTYELNSGTSATVLAEFETAGNYLVSGRATVGGKVLSGAAGVTVRGVFTTLVGDNTAKHEGETLSMATVAGHPAMVYMVADVLSGAIELQYARAGDAEGRTWGAPVTVAANGVFPSLTIVNGRPAIAYAEYPSSGLKYVRASDATGAAWGAPVLVDNTVTSPFLYPSLAMLAGGPAIAYRQNSTGNLRYARATDSDGAAWAAPQTLDLAPNCTLPTLLLVDGHPAVGYQRASSIYYLRASDPAGATWGGPVSVALEAPGYQFFNPSFNIVAGNPAAAFALQYANPSGQYFYSIIYVRATDALGATWGDLRYPVHFETFSTNATLLKEVNGRPQLLWRHIGSGQLYRSRAQDDLGVSWYAPDTGPFAYYQYIGATEAAGGLCIAGVEWNAATRDVYAGRFY